VSLAGRRTDGTRWRFRETRRPAGWTSRPTSNRAAHPEAIRSRRTLLHLVSPSLLARHPLVAPKSAGSAGARGRCDRPPQSQSLVDSLRWHPRGMSPALPDVPDDAAPPSLLANQGMTPFGSLHRLKPTWPPDFTPSGAVGSTRTGSGNLLPVGRCAFSRPACPRAPKLRSLIGGVGRWRQEFLAGRQSSWG